MNHQSIPTKLKLVGTCSSIDDVSALNHTGYFAQVEQRCDWGHRRRFQKQEFPGPIRILLT